MNYNELISVIVPVYNVMNFLDQCVRSLVNQTYTNIEIILINDGSTDSSGEICENWLSQDSRIQLVNQENQGLGYARNVGIMKAKGEIITFVDSDDWITEDALEKMVIIMIRENSNICECNFCQYDNADSNIVKVSMNLSEDSENLSRFDYPHIWGRLYKKSIFIDYDILMPSIPYEDLATFPLILLLARRISFTDEALYIYRINTGKSITDNLSNLKYYPMAIRLLTLNAIKLDIFGTYQDILLQICITHARSALLRAQKFSDPKLFYNLKKDLFSELEEHYPNWHGDEQRCLWNFGSFNLCRALSYLDPSYSVKMENCVNAFVFTSIISAVSDPVSDYKLIRHPNSFRDDMLYKDLMKSFIQIEVGGKDILLIDLLDEHYPILCANGTYITESEAFKEIYRDSDYFKVNPDTKEWIKLWEKKANIFAKIIRTKFKMTRVFLVELYAAEIDSVGKKMNDINMIQTYNDRLSYMYNYLDELLIGVNKISIPKHIMYTDENSKYGNSPFYLNSSMHKYIANEINKLL